jgi:hypothetical protein
MFENHLSAIEEALQTCSLVELDQENVSTRLGFPGFPPNKN